MATLTISMSGATVTANNGTMTYTVDDADLALLVAWASATYSVSLPMLQNAAALQAWVQAWFRQTISAVQAYNTPAPTVPAPISIT